MVAGLSDCRRTKVSLPDWFASQRHDRRVNGVPTIASLRSRKVAQMQIHGRRAPTAEGGGMRDRCVGHTGGRCRRSATGRAAHPERARFVPEAASQELPVLVTTP